MAAPTAAAAVEAVFRDEGGRVIATLARVLGDLDRAEEAVQEALAVALTRWADDGVPANPAAWITTTARNRAIDHLRRDRRLDDKRKLLAARLGTESATVEADPVVVLERLDEPVDDDQLALMFACCHPALGAEAQLALVLRTLGGLTTPEIARAFLVPESTMAQRIVRAKRKVRSAGIPFKVPPDHELPVRLEVVLRTIYLVFNEGYLASEHPDAVRPDLEHEAVQLARVLARLMPDEPEALGLLALLLLTAARTPARIGAGGALTPLEEQDRSLWDDAMIAEGSAVLERALRRRRRGSYQIQAAIAALHSMSPSIEATDWPQVVALYDALREVADSPVVALNRAAATAMVDGPEVALAEIDALVADGTVQGYRLLPAVRGELLRRMGRRAEARQQIEMALAVAASDGERLLLERRLAEVTDST